MVGLSGLTCNQVSAEVLILIAQKEEIVPMEIRWWELHVIRPIPL